MILRKPPQHFVPEWLPRMRERNERRCARVLQEIRSQAEHEAFMLQVRANRTSLAGLAYK